MAAQIVVSTQKRDDMEVVIKYIKEDLVFVKVKSSLMIQKLIWRWEERFTQITRESAKIS